MFGKEELQKSLGIVVNPGCFSFLTIAMLMREPNTAGIAPTNVINMKPPNPN
jgi:hypothetical protein